MDGCKKLFISDGEVPAQKYFSKVKQVKLIKSLVADSNARSFAVLLGVNRNTTIIYFHKLREKTVSRLEQKTHQLMCGEIELDTSYLGEYIKEKEGVKLVGKHPFRIIKKSTSTFN
ncbi:hypothetical protein N5853_08045 [Bartonella sp. HY329]|uniref:hypothetical protein n=1 Tax=unclassified Bartonella TaxID=2645622 RepID=UPI0021C7DC90|nr:MULTISPECIES: hypothetical protein [unclassified Bartonella]UXM94070.1 hypothetical protein N5853_08045 [Bartonella sp. HY329]UXN08392.1 hypothetical protein N5852_08055 [Bartonella sp. HY328]